MMPIQVISRPDAHHERMVMSDFNAPTAKCATRLMPKEAITAPRQSLDKARTLRRVAQHLANLIDSAVQIVLNIDERIWPQPLL